MPFVVQFERLCVVLVATRNPLNLGAAARAVGNFGFGRLRVVNPYEIAFREARSAVGAAAVLRAAAEYKTVAKAVADCSLVVGTTAGVRRDVIQPLRPLQEGALELRRQLASGRVALLFGSEKRGLSNLDISHCHWLMRIPTCSENPSMNLGQAVAVCLYELARGEPALEPSQATKPANAGELERITALLFQALTASGYVKPRTAASTEEKLRRLVRRLQLRDEDAKIWLGMLRQIVWKLRQK
ncbi:MAG TPA: TrmH family RNA methyltransferase [Terriglobales bacterium]|nr:TrmH family RNA methyltransferase [Terriglobales bacterium]